jgi:peptidoglycan hydrolase CwlO-like protein
MILTHSHCILDFIENDCLLDQNRMLCELNQQASTRINDLEDEIKDLRGDNDHLRATINDLHLQEDDLISQVNHLNACLDEKAEEEEELEMEKENAPLHNKLFDLLKAESQVDVSVETKEATFNIKSKDTPAKFKAKTPKRSRVPRTPASMPRAAASMPRPASAIPRESID